MVLDLLGIPKNEQSIWVERQNAIDKILKRYQELSIQAKDKSLPTAERDFARKLKGVASRSLGSVLFTDPKIYDGLLDLGMDPDKLIVEVNKFQKKVMGKTTVLLGEQSHHEIPTGPIKDALKNASPSKAYQVLNRLQDKGIITGDDYRRLYPYPELIHKQAHPYGTSPKSGTLKRAGLVVGEEDVKGLSAKETADLVKRVADQNIEHNRAAWTSKANTDYQRTVNEALNDAGYKGGDPFAMNQRNLGDVNEAQRFLRNLPKHVQQKLSNINLGDVAKAGLLIGVPTARDIIYNKGIAEVVEKASGGQKDKSWLDIGKDYAVGAKDEFVQSLPTAAAMASLASMGGGSALAIGAKAMAPVAATLGADAAMSGLYRGIGVTGKDDHWSKYQFHKTKEEVQQINQAGVESAKLSGGPDYGWVDTVNKVVRDPGNELEYRKNQAIEWWQNLKDKQCAFQPKR